jgi:hypothetical protein
MIEAIIVLMAFLAGLLYGRHLGRTEGLHLGEARAALDLRLKALETGSCPICQYSAETNNEKAQV